jgi:N4-gp56 family major capsid protein
MANTTITIAPELVQQAWAKDTWKAGVEQTFFDKFTGTSADSIVQVRTELQKGDGDTINIPLLMKLKGKGVTGDNQLEGNEEALIYRNFKVTIDQLRHAVRLQGKMDEKKTQINMRKDAKMALSYWLANIIDGQIFSALSANPTSDRVCYAGGKTSESAITADDKFTADLIGKAKRIAMADKNTMIRPVKVDGHDTYVLVIDQYQARDLMNDEKWLNAQQYANVRGEKNPIFSGALGMYDGVVVHQSNDIIRETKGATDTLTSHALFLGAQAAVMAVGDNPTWNEDDFDYHNQIGFEFGRIFGIAKPQFKFDGKNLTDFGCVNVITSSVAD